jgi:HEPN domain-containing protein
MWADEWVARARDDLLAAKRLFNDYHPPQTEICCYHCQQAAEKALKGYLVSRNCAFPYTHDLVQLCQLCVEENDAFKNLLDACSDLTPYATQARYPNSIALENADAELSLQEADSVLGFVDDLLRADTGINGTALESPIL